MRIRPNAVLAIIAAALLSIVVAAPAFAGSGDAKAMGRITWDGESGADPGRVSAFKVWDGAPGQAGDREGDRGWYALRKQNGASMLMDVSCVRIVADEGWARFAGVIVEATPPFTVDEVFLVMVKDSGKRGDEIGMKHRDGIVQGCDNALNDDLFGRKGIITGGNIRIRGPR